MHHAPTVPSLDDASIDYQATSTPPTRMPRRQILPTPPPGPVSSSLILPRNHLLAPYGQRRWSSTSQLLKKSRTPHQSCLRKSRYSCSVIETSSSGGVVVGIDNGRLRHGQRNHGCHSLLQRSNSAMAATSVPSTASSTSRRSGEGLLHEEEDSHTKIHEGRERSVSFYSQVSVFEFAVPPEQRRSQKGWSKYFV